MPEHVVEHIGFPQVIELVRTADEVACDEAAVGHMVEEHVVGHQPRHRHHLPAGQRRQPFGQFGEIGNARLRQFQHVESAQIRLRGAARQELRLPREQRIPHAMLVRREMRPILRHGPVRSGPGRRMLQNVRIVGHADSVACGPATAMGSQMRHVFGWICWMAVVLVGYGAAGMVGGAVPRNAGWTPPADGVRILVESNGVHTDLVLPKAPARVALNALFPGRDLADPRYAAFDHVAVGWGERTFYLETPTWADVRPLTVLRAATGSDRTVLHVEHLRMPPAGEDARAVTLRPDEYRRLIAFVRASFASDRPDAPRWHRTGYGAGDAFYTATGRYSALATCNAGTGDALAAAGVRIGAWTPFPITVLGWFPT